MAEVSKHWFRVRDTYGVQVGPDISPGPGPRHRGRPGRHDRPPGLHVRTQRAAGLLRHDVPVNIVVLTGAGISAESGLATFRDADGLWEGHRVEDVATRRGSRRPRPGARLLRRPPGCADRSSPTRRTWRSRCWRGAGGTRTAATLLVTQNVDDLHDRAGSPSGCTCTARCVRRGARVRRAPGVDRRTTGRHARVCGAVALRPDVVWFGEVPLRSGPDRPGPAAMDVFVSVGTSGAVYPAAAFVQYALARRAHTVELNLAPSEASWMFHDSRSDRRPSWCRPGSRRCWTPDRAAATVPACR